MMSILKINHVIKIYLIEFIKEKDSEFRNPFLLYPDSNKI